MIKLVDFYIGRAALKGILAVWFTMTMLFVMFSLLSELRHTQGDYATLDAFWFTALVVPRMAYQIFPVSALLGALVGVGGLAAQNELVAFRVSGVSRLRLALAALAGVFLVTIPVMIVGEWVAPSAELQARAFRLSEMVGQAIIGGPRGMWMKDGGDIVNIQLPLLSANRGEQSVEFKKVVIYNFSEKVDLTTITRAESATHKDGNWTLLDVSTVHFSESGATKSQAERQLWSTEVRPELLDSAVTRPQRLSVRSLWKYLGYLEENKLDDRLYREAFWEKSFYPLTVIALVLAGMPFVFGPARSQNMGMRLFFGMALGGLFMIVNKTAQEFGGVYGLPSLLTALVPTLLLGVIAVMVLRRAV